MIKKIINTLCFMLALAQSTLALASAPSLYFTVTSQANVITINTKTPGWFYQFAGIQVLTPGYQISGNTFPSGNGSYLFSVSDTQSAQFTINGSAGNIQVKLCLNGVGQTYGCEIVTVVVSLPIPVINSIDIRAADVTGLNFVPGLGARGVTTATFYFFNLSGQICDTSTTIERDLNQDIQINSNTDLTLLIRRIPLNDCIAICNNSVTSSNYPGQNINCTNAVPLL